MDSISIDSLFLALAGKQIWQSIVANTWWAFCAALVLVVIANKITTSHVWSNVVLCGGIGFFAIAVYNTYPVSTLSSSVRLAWTIIATVCMAGILYHFLWERSKHPGTGGKGKAELKAKQRPVAELQSFSARGFNLLNDCYDCDIELPKQGIADWIRDVRALLRRDCSHLEYRLSLIEGVPVPPQMNSDVMQLITERREAVIHLWPKVYQLSKMAQELGAKLPLLPKLDDQLPKPIQIRDLLDGHITDGVALVKRWMKTDGNGFELHRESQIWISLAASIVKSHLTLEHVDELENHYLEMNKS
jgi:hypothetical protein